MFYHTRESHDMSRIHQLMQIFCKKITILREIFEKFVKNRKKMSLFVGINHKNTFLKSLQFFTKNIGDIGSVKRDSTKFLARFGIFNTKS